MKIEFELPLRADRNQNARGHWAVTAKKRASEKAAVAYRLNPNQFRPLLMVTITRIAPRRMDTDGLVGALKGVRDGIAARLGIDDRSPLVQYFYDQESRKPKEYGVRVRIEDPLTWSNMGEEITPDHRGRK